MIKYKEGKPSHKRKRAEPISENLDSSDDNKIEQLDQYLDLGFDLRENEKDFSENNEAGNLNTTQDVHDNADYPNLQFITINHSTLNPSSDFYPEFSALDSLYTPVQEGTKQYSFATPLNTETNAISLITTEDHTPLQMLSSPEELGIFNGPQQSLRTVAHKRKYGEIISEDLDSSVNNQVDKSNQNRTLENNEKDSSTKKTTKQPAKRQRTQEKDNTGENRERSEPTHENFLGA